MDARLAAAQAFHSQLEAKRAQLTPNQLKKQRKKRGKLFQQAAESGLGAGWPLLPAAKRSRLESDEPEASSSLALHDGCEPKSQQQQQQRRRLPDADAADSGDVQQRQPHAAGGGRAERKRRQPTWLAKPLKHLQPRGGSQQQQPTSSRHSSDLSEVCRALQRHARHEQQQDDDAAPGHAQALQQQVAALPSDPPAACVGGGGCAAADTAGTVAAAEPSAVAAATGPASSDGSLRGPCRADLSGQLVVISQQLSSSSNNSSQLALTPCAGGCCSAPAAAAGADAGQQAPQQQLSRKQQRPACRYGNYHHYYGYRLKPVGFEDPRLKALEPSWFRGADVLDVGCNEGLLTLALAIGCRVRSITGVDIDAALISKACSNLSRSRTELTQQFRAAIAARDVRFGRRPALPPPHPGHAADGSSSGPLHVITASSALLQAGRSSSIAAGASGGPSASNSSAVAGMDCAADGSIAAPRPQADEPQQAPPQQQPLAAPAPSQQLSPAARVIGLEQQLKALSRVSFKSGDWLSLPCPSCKYEVVTCFSVTKWVHLNWGDDGITKLFHRFYRCLVPGGLLVLEPQPFRSYRNAVHKPGVQDAPFIKLEQLKLRPEGFADFLTSRVGFTLVRQLGAVSAAAGAEAVPLKGFDRPILVLRKPAAVGRGQQQQQDQQADGDAVLAVEG